MGVKTSMKTRSKDKQKDLEWRRGMKTWSEDLEWRLGVKTWSWRLGGKLGRKYKGRDLEGGVQEGVERGLEAPCTPFPLLFEFPPLSLYRFFPPYILEARKEARWKVQGKGPRRGKLKWVWKGAWKLFVPLFHFFLSFSHPTCSLFPPYVWKLVVWEWMLLLCVAMEEETSLEG